MKLSSGTFRTTIAAALGTAMFPAMLFLGIGTAHANPLTLYPVKHIGGLWVGWDGGSGSTMCTYNSDWFTARAFQNEQGQGGLFIPGVPLNRSWDISVNCDNGDSALLPNFSY